MDTIVLEAKLESLRRCLSRVEQTCPATVEALEKDPDAQDILSLNLSRAIQICVDMAMRRYGIAYTVWPKFCRTTNHGRSICCACQGGCY